ncbi:phage tail protein [Wolbachia endosymbiont (group A) of Conops quadrifasciatus]|uniref:phage tail protein n=1 Tax=Wolbachia endosymbiont (group A) of Conops quadrifasciatus TaxID=3066143 RepID=UPI003132FC23
MIYPHRQNGSLEQLRNMRDIKKPNVLVDGSGKVLGNFVVTNIEETQGSSFLCGLPRKIEFQIKLKSYNR